MGLEIENGGEPKHSRFYFRFILAVVCGVIAVFVFVGVFVWMRYMNTHHIQQVSVATSTQEIPSDLQGALLLSLGVTSTTTGQSRMVPAAIMAHNGTTGYTPFDQLKSGAAMTLQYSLSPDTNRAVFLGTPYVQSSSSSSTLSIAPMMSIYTATGTSPEVDYPTLISRMQSAALVSKPTASDYFREFPIIADDGTIIYSALSQANYTATGTAVATIPAGTWNIFKVGADGTTTLLTSGLHPLWIDATHFAYLKTDGVYVYDLASATTAKIWDIQNVTVATGLAVSNGGGMLAVTDPGAQAVTLLRAPALPDGAVTTIAQATPMLLIPAVASNPMFSPNTNYLALIVAQKHADGSMIPELQFYSIAKQQFLTQHLPFDPQTIHSIYVTDWVI